MQSTCATAQRREINQYKAARMAAGMTQTKASLALFIMTGGTHMFVALLVVGIGIPLAVVLLMVLMEIRFREVKQIIREGRPADADQNPR
jgi:hypothetical protein